MFYWKSFHFSLLSIPGTQDGKVHLHRVEAVMRAIGRMEDNIFKRRREDECRRRIKDERRKQQNRNNRKFGNQARNDMRNEQGLQAPQGEFNN